MVEIPAVSLPLQPVLTAGLLFQTHRSLAEVDRSLCFGSDSQVEAYVLLRQAMAKGNYIHLSILDLITTNYW